MSRGTFNLVRALSNLLREIPRLRKKLKAIKPFAREFRVSFARHEAAIEEQQSELLTMPLPEDQPARRAAEAKRKRQVTRNEKLYQRRVKDWNQYLESTTFIGAFLNRVELVSQRLPLTPEWQVFPDEIRRLEPGIVQLGSWQKKPPNRDLETLEIRLKEMLDLATGSANEAGSRVPWAVPRGVLSPTRGSITPGQIKATSVPDSAVDNPDKGNLALLRGTDGGLKGAVNLAVAARFGGVSRHAIELAAKRGELATQGKRQRRRVLVPSLLDYFPSEE